MSAPFLLGLAGPSGSGKSLISKHLAGHLGGAGILSIDAYYRDLSGLPPSERGKRNFDRPQALDRELFARQLASLARGETVEVPCYDFATHARTERTIPLSPGRHLIVEGLFALAWPEARSLYSLKVFVHLDAGVCLRRRIARDVRERGRSIDSVTEQYERTVRPMCEEHVLPTQEFADITVDGEEPVESSVASILERMAETTR
jgi:uridine kinase